MLKHYEFHFLLQKARASISESLLTALEFLVIREIQYNTVQLERKMLVHWTYGCN